ncbi:MAG: hypothetical protein IKD06_00305 [Clostridia bacterium]|nr:hypothetical protein [Clostridia bacterium]
MKNTLRILVCLTALLLCVSCGGRQAGFSDKDIALDVGGQTVTCGAPMADLLKVLGEPDSYSEAISCAYDGLDKIYVYGDTEIYTFPDGDKDFVLEVAVSGGAAKTAAGVGIGASLEDVVAVYGDSYVEEGISLVYEGSTHRLYFVVEGGKVTMLGMAANAQ